VNIFRSRKKGFALIEIIVVAGIIALLAAITIPHFLRARIRANEISALRGLRSLYSALFLYNLKNNIYPAKLSDLLADNPSLQLLLTTTDETPYRGYVFTYKVKKEKGKGSSKTSTIGYTCEAAPTNIGVTGNNTYRISETGIIEVKVGYDWEVME
jgi:prepilin-type N-terminal cleavage/methylation domain-containing protein